MIPSGLNKARRVLSTRTALATIALVALAVAGAIGSPVGLHW